MKNRLTQTVMALCMLLLTLNASAGDKPVAIKIDKLHNKFVVTNSNGLVSIHETEEFKIEKTMRLMESVKKASFSADGKNFWLFGQAIGERGSKLVCFDSETWKKVKDIECSVAAFDPNCGSVAYASSSFAKELKITDLNTGEKTGGIKFKFSSDDASADYVGYTSDSKYIFAVERKFGSGNTEILKYKAQGYSASPLKTYNSPKNISTGFGNGIVSKGDNHILVGWSETLKITPDTCIVLDRGYDYCHTFYGDDKGEFFYILGREGNKYSFEDMDKTSVEFEKVENKFGNVSAAVKMDEENVVFVTDNFVVGGFSMEGFDLGSKFIDYKVDLVLTERYKDENRGALIEKLKKAGYKVSLPEKYDRYNHPILKESLSVEEAYELLDALDDEHDVNSEIRLSTTQQ